MEPNEQYINFFLNQTATNCILNKMQPQPQPQQHSRAKRPLNDVTLETVFSNTRRGPPTLYFIKSQLHKFVFAFKPLFINFLSLSITPNIGPTNMDHPFPFQLYQFNIYRIPLPKFYTLRPIINTLLIYCINIKI